MPRGGRGGHPHPPRRPVDLTGAISQAEKNDLVTVVNAITEKMHNDISKIFDSPPVSPVSTDQGHHHWLSLPLLHRKDATEDKENMPPSSYPLQQIGEGSASYRNAHKIIEKEEKEAMTPQLRELKKEALAFFRKWQAVILQRIRDISISDPQSAQGGFRGRGRGVPRAGIRGRGGRGGKTGRGGLTLATGPPRVPSRHTDLGLAGRCPPIPNTLWTLPQDKRKLLLHIVFLVSLSLSEYSANSYALLMNLTSCLNLPLDFFYAEEARLAKTWAQAALDVSDEDLLSLKAEEAKGQRKWKGRSQSGAARLAPALTAAGIAAGLLGPMAEGGRAICNLFGINPAKPTTKMMEVFAREIQDFGLLPIHGECQADYIDARQRPAGDRRFRLVIAMGGWMAEDEDMRKPWLCLGRQTEAYVLRWDPVALLSLGSSLETVIRSSAWSSAKKEINATTIFTSLIKSTWPVSLLKISKIMDNPWSIGMVRAEKAGAILADAIMRHKFQGERPVSLVGYGLASRAIYTCLMVLAERRHFGLVESVVMMGAPVPSESRVWLTLKSVVSGRLINVYSEQDYLLGFLYRFSNTQFGVAGLQEIQGADGVENYNVGDLPKGHLGYASVAGRVLKDIGWGNLDSGTVKQERPARQERQPKKGRSPRRQSRQQRWGKQERPAKQEATAVKW
ncbi:putative membrane protein-like protein [Hapsidospora chrysogenum ATCC 11550]|uniref:Putative membrane protein-like protein n=1 Tax=Hapsidospora chrysogenum (strain ATCC 11550 / CBS 779.69 / DSM 880 / IAM 14645 / JCM 23072 / IMI 49137) TaxID=857340 RepID=A0A086TGX7_HAPC1|nr:putative membrane protein-like protein [Hapsidospora chrysogenum ATCC 11550]